MLRVVLFLLAVALAAVSLDWLARHPGVMTVDWMDYRVEASMFQAVVGFLLALVLGILLYNLVRHVWRTPAVVGRLITRRKERRGLDALSEGMIAIGSGDRQRAARAALQARKSLPNEPLTHLLRAQTAELSGDSATSRRIFEAMLANPDTEQLGLRGLFLEAQREGAPEPARQFAERALKSNPALGWPIDALFDLQCRAEDWDGALETLTTGRRYSHIARETADRRRAVLLTAKAQAKEHTRTDEALGYAREAHKLAPDLVPAAAIAGRILAGKGQTAPAAKILERTWKLNPHPDIATAYAYARVGDSATDRIARIKNLTKADPSGVEGAIALATVAIDARDWETARQALAPLVKGAELPPSQRVCTLMARLESAESGDAGRVREWLARAVHAPRDPAWTADGVASETWAPLSPRGRLDAFEWRVPVADAVPADIAVLAEKTRDLTALAAPRPVEAVLKPNVPDIVDIETTLRTVADDATSGFADAARPAKQEPNTGEQKNAPVRSASARVTAAETG
jgi:HemY protein